MKVRLTPASPGERPVYRSVAALGLFVRFYAEARQHWETVFPQLVDKHPTKGEWKKFIWDHSDVEGLEPTQIFGACSLTRTSLTKFSNQQTAQRMPWGVPCKCSTAIGTRRGKRSTRVTCPSR